MKLSEREQLAHELESANAKLLRLRTEVSPDTKAEINNILTVVRMAIADIELPDGVEFGQAALERAAKILDNP